MNELIERLRRLVDSEAGALPLPGLGATAERYRSLCAWGREDLSLARLAEAHTDALAIIAEAGREAAPGAMYGVWASDGPDSRLEAQLIGSGWLLKGVKQYCSGASLVSNALVTAHVGDAVLLFDVSLAAQGVRIEPSCWATPAMADTDTAPVRFTDVTVNHRAVVGGEDWYLQRPGFWHGAIGPAACWAGGALSLVNAARPWTCRNPHSRAHQGGMEAAAWSLEKHLDCAAAEIDADPEDHGSGAKRRALIVRHLIERACIEILERFGRATGPRLLAYDRHVTGQHAALLLYLRQSHAENDLELIQAPMEAARINRGGSPLRAPSDSEMNLRNVSQNVPRN